MTKKKPKSLKPLFLGMLACLAALGLIVYFGFNWAEDAGVKHEAGNCLLVGLSVGLLLGVLRGWWIIIGLALGLVFIFAIYVHNGLGLSALFVSFYGFSFIFGMLVRAAGRALMRDFASHYK